MEAQVDGHHAWLAGRWDEDRHCDLSAVRQWEYQQWIHGAAGTGMENLGWGWRGWPFWLRDRRMYSLMNHGVETAQAFRFFDMGTLVPPGLVLVMPSCKPTRSLIACSLSGTRTLPGRRPTRQGLIHNQGLALFGSE